VPKKSNAPRKVFVFVGIIGMLTCLCPDLTWSDYVCLGIYQKNFIRGLSLLFIIHGRRRRCCYICYFGLVRSISPLSVSLFLHTMKFFLFIYSLPCPPFSFCHPVFFIQNKTKQNKNNSYDLECYLFFITKNALPFTTTTTTKISPTKIQLIPCQRSRNNACRPAQNQKKPTNPASRESLIKEKGIAKAGTLTFFIASTSASHPKFLDSPSSFQKITTEQNRKIVYVSS